ncbi:MAG: ATP-binding protein [Thermoleophilia bacterium]|nr:ATP-binding protein [Thermoleophilia bacterium]
MRGSCRPTSICSPPSAKSSGTRSGRASAGPPGGGAGRATSNRGFEQWGEILGDAMVAAALIDRLVHRATMIVLKGKSYRLRERGVDVAPAAQAPSLRDSA